MKTKFFALMIALFCLCVILAACGKAPCETHVDEDADGICDVCGAACEPTETEPPCPHPDDDANKICDACGIGLVAMPTMTPAETEAFVEMVVNQAPADARPEDYIRTEPLDQTYTKAELDGFITDTYGEFALVTKPVSTTDEYGTNYTYTTYAVVNLATNTVVLEAGNNNDGNVPNTDKAVWVYFSNGYFTVETTKFSSAITPDEITELSIVYYTYSGDLIAQYNWDADTAEDPAPNAPALSEEGYLNQVYYVAYQEKLYAIDANSYKLLHSENQDTIVKRPAMDGVQGNIGYTDDGNGHIKLYDLTQWISCVYDYDVPANAQNYSAWQLADGSVLVQYTRELPVVAVSYDYIDSGYKYDIVYVLIDGTAKETREVEFGYWISGVSVIGDGNSLFTDKAENVVTAYAVDGILTNDEKILVVGNDLSVLCDVKIPLNSTPVGNGLYACDFLMNSSEMVTKIVDINGDLYTHPYIESGVIAAAGYKESSYNYGKLYTYDNKPIIDLYDGWYPIGSGDDFVILSGTDDTTGETIYYYYDLGAVTPVAIGADKTDFNLVNSNDWGYIVSFRDAQNNLVYEIYDANNQKIAESVSYPTSFSLYNSATGHELILLQTELKDTASSDPDATVDKTYIIQ